MKIWRTVRKIFAGIAAGGLLLLIVLYIQGRASDSPHNRLDAREISERFSVRIFTKEPLPTCLGAALDSRNAYCMALFEAEGRKVAEEQRLKKEVEDKLLAAEQARQEAASQEAPATEQSCEEMLAEWEAMYAGVPSAGRAGMPCGPCAAYSSRWTCEQAIGRQ